MLKAADALSGRQNRGCEDLIRTVLKGTCWVSRVRRQKRTAKQGRRRVRIGAPDASLTGLAGLVAVDELTGRQVHAPGRARIATLRRQLLTTPGRLITHARRLTLRLPPGHHRLQAVLNRLRALPAPT